MVVLVAVSLALTLSTGCAPNRQAWMAHAAKEQVATATEDMGTPDQVRAAARAEGAFLNGVATTIYGNADKYPAQQREGYYAIARSAAEIAGGLEAISNAKTDAAFTNAIFAMCDPDRRKAEPVVGQMELAFAGAIRAGKLGQGDTPLQREQTAAILTSFGDTMLSIPGRCDQAEKAMAEADSAERQAEVQHEANVNRALSAATVLFAGTAMVAGAVGAAAATRPPVSYTYINQYNSNGY